VAEGETFQSERRLFFRKGKQVSSLSGWWVGIRGRLPSSLWFGGIKLTERGTVDWNDHLEERDWGATQECAEGFLQREEAE